MARFNEVPYQAHLTYSQLWAWFNPTSVPKSIRPLKQLVVPLYRTSIRQSTPRTPIKESELLHGRIARLDQAPVKHPGISWEGTRPAVQPLRVAYTSLSIFFAGSLLRIIGLAPGNQPERAKGESLNISPEDNPDILQIHTQLPLAQFKQVTPSYLLFTT